MKHNDKTAKGKMVASVCLYLFVFVTLTKCGKLATSALTLIDVSSLTHTSHPWPIPPKPREEALAARPPMRLINF
jgi:hypothetical protein